MKHQNKIKWISFCLAALLLVAGCRATEPFSVSLGAAEAELSQAPNVTPMPEGNPEHLDGWMQDDTVSFRVNLPQDDVYTLTLAYSRAGQIGTAEGRLEIEGADSKILEFPGTSEDAMDWSVYTEISFQTELTAGVHELVLTPENVPPRSEFFISLQKITLTGTKPAPKDQPEETQAAETTKPTATVSSTTAAASAEDFSGWWVLASDSEEDVVSSVTTFFVDAKNSTWTSYDRLGDAGETMPCIFSGDGTIQLELVGLSHQKFYLDNGTLFCADNGQKAYVHAEDPDFLRVPSFAGTWILADQEAGHDIYKITETTVTRSLDDISGQTVPYTRTLQSVQYGGETLRGDILCLDVEWPEPDLYPSADGNLLIENGQHYYGVYVREGSSVTEDYAMNLMNLVNMKFDMDVDNGQRYGFQLRPDFTFAVISMIPEGDTDTQDPDGVVAMGHWDLDQDLQLHMMYEDGAEDVLELNTWRTRMQLDHLDLEFLWDELT